MTAELWRDSCTKARFYTEHQAEEALAAITANPWTPRIPTRTYLCPICTGWHLTSQPKRRLR